MALGPIVSSPKGPCSGSVANCTARGLVNCVASILTHLRIDHPCASTCIIFVQALNCTQINCAAHLLAAAGMLEERSLSDSPAVRGALLGVCISTATQTLILQLSGLDKQAAAVKGR